LSENASASAGHEKLAIYVGESYSGDQISEILIQAIRTLAIRIRVRLQAYRKGEKQSRLQALPCAS
jgi:hypothetical protein